MVYTEIKKRNGKRYFYRVISIRKGKEVSKKRRYMGVDIPKEKLEVLEKEADSKLNIKEIKSKKAISKIKPKIIQILKENKVKKAGIFGSYARGEQDKNSDIDMLVEIDDKNMSLIGFIRLMRILGESLKKKVDLVEYNSIKPQVKEQILGEEIRII